ncbi:hypothetical protein CVIRNUC_000992 [Coccomyxa viridis]|uniref:Chlorophyll a-b binding protein, chloroplastic n=1 Tax=Coccomyxa viridis TaxID=1274662 RepID=A0AAV1HUP9_9CHLO|nr:hypothetical protein CVIRNUC_000992 [Coccomyxa viridis]
MAAMTMSTAISSRAALLKPFNSAKPAQRRLVVRAQDPAAPDPSAVDGEVRQYAATMPGISQPFPNIFDPLNLLGNTGASNTKIRELRRWREAEVTHGRVSMLAALGFIVQEQLEDFPGPFPHVTGPAIYHFQQVEAKGATFWTPLLLVIGICEAYRVGLGWAEPTSGNFYSLRDDYEPGNLGFDPVGLLPEDPKARYEMQTKELNNGRLAMIAIAAFVVQELISGQELFEHTAKKLGI